MGSRLGTNKGTVNVHLPPDVMAAFEQYRENNCPDQTTSALARELIIIALSKSQEIGTMDAIRRAEAARTRAWMCDRIGPFLRELAETVETTSNELHRELAVEEQIQRG